MKRSPDMRRLVDRLAPGVLCREGFLGGDRRELEDILDADASAVAAAGLTHRQIAARLGEILRQALENLGRPVGLSGGWTAVLHEGMGRIPCPWADGVFPKGEVELTHGPTGRVVRFTPLSVHLIAAHGFYQGRGSRYRLEAKELAELMSLRASPGSGV